MYLVLLLNLGSPLHHLHFLGFHPKSCGSQTAECSCLGHGSVESDGAGLDGSLSRQNVSAEHQCVVCKFFDQYHVVAIDFGFEVTATPLDDLPTETVLNLDPAAITSTARGPPAIS